MIKIPKIQISLRLCVEAHRKLNEIARCENRTLSGKIKNLIHIEIHRYEVEHGTIVLTTEELYPK